MTQSVAQVLRRQLSFLLFFDSQALWRSARKSKTKNGQLDSLVSNPLVTVAILKL